MKFLLLPLLLVTSTCVELILPFEGNPNFMVSTNHMVYRTHQGGEMECKTHNYSTLGTLLVTRVVYYTVELFKDERPLPRPFRRSVVTMESNGCEAILIVANYGNQKIFEGYYLYTRGMLYKMIEVTHAAEITLYESYIDYMARTRRIIANKYEFLKKIKPGQGVKAAESLEMRKNISGVHQVEEVSATRDVGVNTEDTIAATESDQAQSTSTQKKAKLCFERGDFVK